MVSKQHGLGIRIRLIIFYGSLITFASGVASEVVVVVVVVEMRPNQDIIVDDQ